MKTFIGAMVLTVATLPAFAQHDVHPSDIDARQQRLERRIERGWQSGELTRPEYRRLRHELRLVERDQHAFWADGRLSPRERDHLHARLDELSRVVFEQRRDGERRYGHYNGPHDAGRRY
jgi:hypothetical protein